MKLPSLNYLADEALASAKRFPLTLLSAFVAVVVAVYLIEFESDIPNKFPLVNLLLVSALGLVLFFCVPIFNEKVGRSRQSKWGLNLLALLLLILVYYSLPDSEHTNIYQPYIKYVIYNVVAHLLVSFAPFISQGKINGFWQYNKMLFLRFCLSILYSAFVYVGITLALVSLNLLFDAEIEGETFFQLFVVVIGLFNTWFFVAGIGRNVEELEANTEYPKGLKTFTQYVLLPLLIIYLVILYAYVIKIVGLWDWPKGIVSYLIVCVAVLGIFTVLLFHPYQNNERKHWIAIFSKVYYYALLPLTATLFVAIGIRLSDYGITVNRYLIVELGVWLLFVSIYFILGKRNIKVIPMSLAGMILLSSFGFWGMFGVSEKSQVGRLEKILVENGILVNGKVQNEPVLIVENDTVFNLDKRDMNVTLLSDSLNNEVYSILNYLDDFHGFDAINEWYSLPPDSVQTAIEGSNKYYYYNGARTRMELLGLDYRYYYASDDNERRSYYHNDDYESNAKKVTGYDYVLDINSYNYVLDDYKNIEKFSVDNHSFQLSQTDSLQFLLVADESDSIQFDLTSLLAQLKSRYGENDSYTAVGNAMTLDVSGDRYVAQLRINNMTIFRDKNITIESLNGSILLKNKEED